MFGSILSGLLCFWTGLSRSRAFFRLVPNSFSLPNQTKWFELVPNQFIHVIFHFETVCCLLNFEWRGTYHAALIILSSGCFFVTEVSLFSRLLPETLRKIRFSLSVDQMQRLGKQCVSSELGCQFLNVCFPGIDTANDINGQVEVATKVETFWRI